MNDTPGLVRRVRTDYLAETYKIPSWSKQQIAAFLDNPIGPMASIPMKCHGKKACALGATCVLADEDIEIDSLCPIEKRLVAEIFFSYAAHLNVTPEDYTDINVLWNLVRATIQARRFDAHLQEQDVLIDQVIGIDPETGKLVKNIAVHPAIAGQERLLKTTMHVLSKMVATRKDKIDASAKGNRAGVDPMAVMAAARGLLMKEE